MITADLHIHTCLSPCADLTMSPKRVVERAAELKLDVIGICDHNSAENVSAAVNVGREKEVTVFPGMEVTSSEEVHLLGLFDRIEPAMRLQEEVYQHLTPGQNVEDSFGQQIVANEEDEVEGYNQRILSGATALNLFDLVALIHRLGGLAIAAHVDRDVYSILSQLGYIPDDLELDAVEITANISFSEALASYPDLNRFPMVTSSDAHYLDDIGTSVSRFPMAEPTLTAMKTMLKRHREGDYIRSL